MHFSRCFLISFRNGNEVLLFSCRVTFEAGRQRNVFYRARTQKLFAAENVCRRRYWEHLPKWVIWRHPYTLRQCIFAQCANSYEKRAQHDAAHAKSPPHSFPLRGAKTPLNDSQRLECIDNALTQVFDACEAIPRNASAIRIVALWLTEMFRAWMSGARINLLVINLACGENRTRKRVGYFRKQQLCDVSACEDFVMLMGRLRYI